jgi:hypothetical protein
MADGRSAPAPGNRAPDDHDIGGSPADGWDAEDLDRSLNAAIQDEDEPEAD